MFLSVRKNVFHIPSLKKSRSSDYVFLFIKRFIRTFNKNIQYALYVSSGCGVLQRRIPIAAHFRKTGYIVVVLAEEFLQYGIIQYLRIVGFDFDL